MMSRHHLLYPLLDESHSKFFSQRTIFKPFINPDIIACPAYGVWLLRYRHIHSTTHPKTLKAIHCCATITHVKRMNPHLTNKGSSPSPGAFNNMAYISISLKHSY